MPEPVVGAPVGNRFRDRLSGRPTTAPPPAFAPALHPHAHWSLPMTDPAPSTHSAIDVTTDSSSDADIAASTAGAPAAGVQPGESVLATRTYGSPLGQLRLIAGAGGLCAVLWPDDERPVLVGARLDARTLAEPIDADERAEDGGRVSGGTGDAEPRAAAMAREAEAILDETVRQLDEYFTGTRRRFDLTLDPVGTEFQVAVWRSLAEIAYGETATYGEQAARIGRPTAVRAVGAANGRNPLSIVLPCHRVVGSDGRLTGFAGGLDAKAYLLDHEARHTAGS